MQGKTKTYLEMRNEACNNILDEVLFIARATEGAVSVDWVMNQPIGVRKKYVKDLSEELKKRQAELNSLSKNK